MADNTVVSSVGIQNSPVVILRKYFGFLPGQSLKDFSEELKALTPQERKELADLASIEMARQFPSRDVLASLLT